MPPPEVSKERSGELACFNGVGGSGRESEFAALIAPSMARVIKETDFLEFVTPAIQRLSPGDEIACFNGVGGSGREISAAISAKTR